MEHSVTHIFLAPLGTRGAAAQAEAWNTIDGTDTGGNMYVPFK